MLWMWFTVWDQYMKHSRKETINSVIWKEIKTRPLFIFQVKVAGAVLHQKTICSRLIVPTWREMAQLLIANKSKEKNLIYFRWQQPKNIEEVYWLVSTKVKWCWYGKRNCEHKPCSMAAHSSIQASLLGDRWNFSPYFFPYSFPLFIWAYKNDDIKMQKCGFYIECST